MRAVVNTVVLGVVCGAVLCSFAAPAVAAPIDDAKKAFADGKAAFERGDYEHALAAYQRANMILPAPNLYYNIGVTYERLGRYQDAALAFDRYLEQSGAPQNDEDRDFQSKLRQRADGDRRRPDVPPRAAPQQPAPPPPMAYQPPPGYYGPAPYAPQATVVDRATRLREAKRHRTNGIILMAIGVPLSVAGIGVLAFVGDTDAVDTRVTQVFVGATCFLVGVTLWAPGAASFVRWNRAVQELNRPEPGVRPLGAAWNQTMQDTWRREPGARPLGTTWMVSAPAIHF